MDPIEGWTGSIDSIYIRWKDGSSSFPKQKVLEVLMNGESDGLIDHKTCLMVRWHPSTKGPLCLFEGHVALPWPYDNQSKLQYSTWSTKTRVRSQGGKHSEFLSYLAEVGCNFPKFSNGT